MDPHYEIPRDVFPVQPHVYAELSVSTTANYYDIRDTDTATTSRIRQEFEVYEIGSSPGVCSWSRQNIIGCTLGILLVASVSVIGFLLILFLNKGNAHFLRYLMVKQTELVV